MGPEMKLDTETTATRLTATDIVVALTFDVHRRNIDQMAQANA